MRDPVNGFLHQLTPSIAVYVLLTVSLAVCLTRKIESAVLFFWRAHKKRKRKKTASRLPFVAGDYNASMPVGYESFLVT